MKITDEAVGALARTLADLRFVSMVGVTDDTRQKLVAIMGDRPANEVVAELIEERYQGLHNKQVIPEAAVTAARLALEDSPLGGLVGSGALRFEDFARAALEAALPHIAADERADLWDEGNLAGKEASHRFERTNPYRPAK